MGAMTGLIAGLATLGGAVALYRFANKKSGELKMAVDELKRRATGDTGGAVLDYQRDPDDGVYRAKP